MRIHYLVVMTALAACSKVEEDAVAKRDTGVAPARVTTETGSTPAAGTTAGVPAVPSDSTARSATTPTGEAVHIKPPLESLRVKP
jgi:hypothetical protein